MATVVKRLDLTVGELVEIAGADRLDCIGDVLRGFYERAGYRVVQRTPWDDRFKPHICIDAPTST
jgi:hypothetical protein